MQKIILPPPVWSALNFLTQYQAYTALLLPFHRFIFSALLMMNAWLLTAQVTSSGIQLPPSPEASGMGKYGDIPVGEHAGTANVSVPIYVIQTRQGAVPISLNYHTGGVRVAQEAEWTGLGWSLQAGGSITRAIRGLDDFGDHVGHCVNAPFENYYQRGIGNNASGSPRGNLINPGYFNDSDEPGIYNEGYLRIRPMNTAEDRALFYEAQGTVEVFTYEQLCPDSEGVVDTESDLYSINLPGISAKFFLDDTGTPRLLEAGNIQINLTYNGVENVSWVLRGPDGVEYVLGNSRNSRQMQYAFTKTTVNGQNQASTCNAGSPVYNKYISSWLLDEIRYPSGEKITFQYQFAASAVAPIPAYSDSKEDLAAYLPPPPGQTWTGQNETKETKSISFLKYDRNDLSIISVFLRGGTAPIETVVFENSDRLDLTGGKKLDRIKINRGGQLFKWYQLGYDYFQSSLTAFPNRWERFTNNTHLGGENYRINTLSGGSEISDFVLTEALNSRRLKLASVQDMGNSATAQSSEIPPFRFDYNGTALPPKTALAIDHYGFSNGNTENNTLYPSFSGVLEELPISTDNPVSLNLPGADRESNEMHAQSAALVTIHYPTGGSTEFDYELNRYVDDEYVAHFHKERVHIEPRSPDCSNVPSVQPGEFFNINDIHPSATSITIKTSWTIESNCNTCLDNQNCLLTGSPGDPQYNPGLGFKFIFERQNGTVLFEQVWYSPNGPVQIEQQNSQTTGRLQTTLPVSMIQPNENYRLRISAYGLNNQELPWNIIAINFTVEWRTEMDDVIVRGPGLRIQQITDKDEIGASESIQKSVSQKK